MWERYHCEQRKTIGGSYIILCGPLNLSRVLVPHHNHNNVLRAPTRTPSPQKESSFLAMSRWLFQIVVRCSCCDEVVAHNLYPLSQSLPGWLAVCLCIYLPTKYLLLAHEGEAVVHSKRWDAMGSRFPRFGTIRCTHAGNAALKSLHCKNRNKLRRRGRGSWSFRMETDGCRRPSVIMCYGNGNLWSLDMGDNRTPRNGPTPTAAWPLFCTTHGGVQRSPPKCNPGTTDGTWRDAGGGVAGC